MEFPLKIKNQMKMAKEEPKVFPNYFSEEDLLFIKDEKLKAERVEKKRGITKF